MVKFTHVTLSGTQNIIITRLVDVNAILAEPFINQTKEELIATCKKLKTITRQARIYYKLVPSGH